MKVIYFVAIVLLHQIFLGCEGTKSITFSNQSNNRVLIRTLEPNHDFCNPNISRDSTVSLLGDQFHYYYINPKKDTFIRATSLTGMVFNHLRIFEGELLIKSIEVIIGTDTLKAKSKKEIISLLDNKSIENQTCKFITRRNRSKVEINDK